MRIKRIFHFSQKDINIGPTAIMALMTQKISHYGPEYAVLLTLLSGIIILVSGLLQLGFLIDFISLPVIVGFTSSAAVTIASGQATFHVLCTFFGFITFSFQLLF